MSTGVSCGDVDARRDGCSHSEDGERTDPAINPNADWMAKHFGAAPVDDTDQDRLGDDDDARDAQRGRQPHQVTPLQPTYCLIARRVMGDESGTGGAEGTVRGGITTSIPPMGFAASALPAQAWCLRRQ